MSIFSSEPVEDNVEFWRYLANRRQARIAELEEQAETYSEVVSHYLHKEHEGYCKRRFLQQAGWNQPDETGWWCPPDDRDASPMRTADAYEVARNQFNGRTIRDFDTWYVD